MKKLITLLSLILITTASYATSEGNQVVVSFEGKVINILHMSNLEGKGLNALLQLRKAACYTGNQYDVIDNLNDLFNFTERNKVADAWPIQFTGASTPNIPEQKLGLSDSIGIVYEVKSENYQRVRFTINRCK